MSARLANLCTRPVELHLASGQVVVLAAMAQIDCTAEDLELAQVRQLTMRGILAGHPDLPAPTPTAPGSRAPRGRTPARKRATAAKAAPEIGDDLSRSSTTRRRSR